MESLIVKTSPVIDNHVFVESFEKSTSGNTNRFQTLFFGIPDPLLFGIWAGFRLTLRKIGVMDTGSSWSILILWISRDAHLVSILIFFTTFNVEWESIDKRFHVIWLCEINWMEGAFLNGKLVFSS